jgi:hypothetical protein
VFALCLFVAVACKKQEAKTEPAPAPGGTEQPATGGDAGGTMANTAAMCGGVAAVKCAGENEYCQMDEGKCMMADASGTCMKKPDTCVEMSAPVCGCDGQTYDNACKASMAGVSVKAAGACAP